MNPIFFDIFDGNLFDNNITNGTGLADNIVLDNGNDTSDGGAGDDLMYGNGGSDSLLGNAGSDNIQGGSGNDTLDGGAGNDTLDGGANNDTYLFDTDLVLGSDRLIDASGIDTLNFAATTTKTINLNLGSTAAQTVTAGNLTLTLASATAFENVIGGSLNDNIIGNTLANSLTGGAGNDSLSGGDGNDTLIGGSGTDTMTDGAGDDIYRFLSVSDSQVGAARDILTDFSPGFDKIDLSAIDANTTIAGDQAFTFVTGGIGGGGQVNYFISGSSLIVQAEIEGDGNLTVDMQIQLNGGLSAIAAKDFIL